MAKASTYRARLGNANYFVISPNLNSCFIRKPFRVLNYPGPFTIFVSGAMKYPFKAFPQTIYAKHYYFSIRNVSECRFSRGYEKVDYRAISIKADNYVFHLNKERRLQKILDDMLKHKDNFLLYIPNATQKIK